MLKASIRNFIYLLFLIMLSTIIDVSAQAVTIKIGDKIPDFKAIDQDGKDWHLSDHLHKSDIVIYFYPAAMTSGCTKQACGFRDSKNVFDSLGVQIVGISGDLFENLNQFKKAYDLNFDLLSDADGKIAKAFGVPVRDGGIFEKVINNKQYKLSRPITTARWTFVLDKNSTIIYKNSDVNAAKDSQIILDLLTNKEIK